jgi:predicted ATPase
MIERVKIKGYKSLSDVELNLKPLTVLIGPNAAGKSNFLDALQLLSRVANSETLKDAFDPPYRGDPLESFTFGKNGIRGLLDKDNVSFSMEVDVKLSKDVIDSVNEEIMNLKGYSLENEEKSGRYIKVREELLRYKIEIEIVPKSGTLRVSNEYLAALRKTDREPKESRKPFLSREGDHLKLRLEGQGRPTHVDRYLDRSVISKSLYAPHYPHMVAMKEELSRWLFHYFEPREKMRSPSPIKEVNHVGMMGEDLSSYLNTIKSSDERQFKSIVNSLKMIIPSITDLDIEINDLGQVEITFKEGDISIPARLVSEGTLRVLGLLTLSGVREPASLLGFEEPENGVHPNRIETIAEYLKTQASSGDTQLIITTHSPLLSDRLPKDSLYVCNKNNGITEITPFSSWGPLADRKNIDEALRNSSSVSERMVRGDFDD